jgi:hypothetical protein
VKAVLPGCRYGRAQKLQQAAQGATVGVVDRNLEDDRLLERIRLGAFDPIGIREGYCDQSAEPSATCPRVGLRLKDELLAGSGSLWDEHKMRVVSAPATLSTSGDTQAIVEPKLKARSRRGRLTHQDELVASVLSRQQLQWRVHSRRLRHVTGWVYLALVSTRTWAHLALGCKLPDLPLALPGVPRSALGSGPTVREEGIAHGL